MSRFQRSLALFRASWAVLKSDRSLVLFPVYSALASIALALVFGLIGWATVGSETTTTGGTHYTTSAVTYVVGIVAYVGLAFVQTYFLAGLVASADQVLHGRSTTVGSGLRVASSRAGRLLPWAVLTATVSWILQALEERAGFIGRIVVSLLGAAWTVLTFLTVPIIVFEDVGPITALKRSGTLLKQTWGENLFAQLGFGFFMLVPILAAFVIGGLGIASNVTVVAVLAVAVAVIVVVVASVIVSALGGIYRTALYRYAVDGTVPGAFGDIDLQHAFGPRRGLGRS